MKIARQVLNLIEGSNPIGVVSDTLLNDESSSDEELFDFLKEFMKDHELLKKLIKKERPAFLLHAVKPFDVEKRLAKYFK